MFGWPYTYWPGSGVRWLINRWLFSNIYLPNPRIIKPLLCERDMRTWAALNLVPLEFPVKELAKSSAGRQRPIPGINAESFFLFFADDDNRRPVGHLHNKIAAIHSRRNDLNLNFAKKAPLLFFLSPILCGLVVGRPCTYDLITNCPSSTTTKTMAKNVQITSGIRPMNSCSRDYLLQPYLYTQPVIALPFSASLRHAIRPPHNDTPHPSNAEPQHFIDPFCQRILLLLYMLLAHTGLDGEWVGGSLVLRTTCWLPGWMPWHRAQGSTTPGRLLLPYRVRVEEQWQCVHSRNNNTHVLYVVFANPLWNRYFTHYEYLRRTHPLQCGSVSPMAFCQNALVSIGGI